MTGTAREILRLENICREFNGRRVLDGLSLTVNEGEYISITGVSGAGKSTLINIIGLMDMEYTGKYYYRHQEVDKRRADEIRNRHLGFVFQQFHLLPKLTVFDNILLGAVYYRGETDARTIGLKYLERVGMKGREYEKVCNLSGGEKQRVALVRSMVLQPEIIIADEPTANLDCDNAEQVMQFLSEACRNGKTVIVVTHDRLLAGRADRIYELKNGGIR